MQNTFVYIELFLKGGNVHFCISDFLLVLFIFCLVFKCILFVHVDESAKWRKNAIKYFTFEGLSCSDIISFSFFLKNKTKIKANPLRWINYCFGLALKYYTKRRVPDIECSKCNYNRIYFNFIKPLYIGRWRTSYYKNFPLKGALTTTSSTQYLTVNLMQPQKETELGNKL